MTSRAHVEFDPTSSGLRVAMTRGSDNGPIHQVLQWEPLAVRTYDATEGVTQPGGADWLRLPEDDARALYEALADHFGHFGHDTRALRKDYDAERARVDKLITHLTSSR
ncbi:hypothetical protein [Jatrophihabitans sp.]|uniref:hypothetical protein n=1 Tax=Jatrophihabitans sp. TaxID=1932789 RepID=UPI0030C77D15|nr:hypothetical protein [Jatrophihabitans sp.]